MTQASPKSGGAIAGLVLAGGASSRMGSDKAQLKWRGVRLLDHAASLLKTAGAEAVFVLGRKDEPGGLADEAPGAGPARAISDAVRRLHKNGWERFLIAPVDMPLMTAEALSVLTDAPDACAYAGHPMPLYLAAGALNAKASKARSVRALLQACGAESPPAPDETLFANINTAEDYARLRRNA